MVGRIRVGRSRYVNGRVILPQYPGFIQVVVLTENFPGGYHELCPYFLRDEEGRYMENIYQFSKVYATVPQVKIPYSKKNSKVVWEHPSEVHLDAHGELTPAYWNWRKKGMTNSNPVRNPVGWDHMKTCKFAVEKDQPISEENPPLDYIQGRKRIYLPWYQKLVQTQPRYQELKNHHLTGKNLLIIEVDGPHQESLAYYREKYGVPENFIEGDSMEATPEYLEIMLNDRKHPFGHGYCLAFSLLGL